MKVDSSHLTLFSESGANLSLVGDYRGGRRNGGRRPRPAPHAPYGFRCRITRIRLAHSRSRRAMKYRCRCSTRNSKPETGGTCRKSVIIRRPAPHVGGRGLRVRKPINYNPLICPGGNARGIQPWYTSAKIVISSRNNY
ncbi:hypothetical protein EVAR_7223_1 [Eumeta japonica]|uniref:Uncharacterized protein n=1 Tax=Eumeta variegata TaxID=151549 RepID=A0A4C1T357_EUMVA|nr:hypothetical protein EVAR_7223_1 [Eumeta japonica]